eukprot:2490330-Rhodomonas_salina.3
MLFELLHQGPQPYVVTQVRPLHAIQPLLLATGFPESDRAGGTILRKELGNKTQCLEDLRWTRARAPAPVSLKPIRDWLAEQLSPEQASLITTPVEDPTPLENDPEIFVHKQQSLRTLPATMRSSGGNGFNWQQ